MNGMELPSKVKTNVTIFKVLAWISIILGIIMGIIFIVIGIASGASEDATSVMVFIVSGVLTLIMCVVLGILYFLVAKGIRNRKGWAKILGIIFSILMLTSIPIGTVLGIILLINFFNDEFKNWYEEKVTETPVV